MRGFWKAWRRAWENLSPGTLTAWLFKMRVRAPGQNFWARSFSEVVRVNFSSTFWRDGKVMMKDFWESLFLMSETFLRASGFPASAPMPKTVSVGWMMRSPFWRAEMAAWRAASEMDFLTSKIWVMRAGSKSDLECQKHL